jgi:hypothetical protein
MPHRGTPGLVRGLTSLAKNNAPLFIFLLKQIID